MSAPYYEDGQATLWCGCWEDVVPRLAPTSVDLVIADPPYGVGWQSHRRALAFDRIDQDDGTFDLAGLVVALWRVLRARRHLYLFGPGDEAALTAAGFRRHVELIWDKELVGPGDVELPWGPAHERITFAVRPHDKGPAQEKEGALAARLRRGSVLRHARPNAGAVTRHPTEKPVGLLRELIESSSRFDELVLDPCAGVGSTLVAAKLEGRKSIGIEPDERYCEIAANRLAQQTLNLEVA